VALAGVNRRRDSNFTRFSFSSRSTISNGNAPPATSNAIPRASPLSAGQRPSQQMPRDVHTGSRSTTTTPCRHVRRRTSASTREADRLRRQTHQYASPSSFVSWPLRQPLSARDSAKELQQRQQSPPRMPFHHHLPTLDSYSIFPMPSPSLLIGSAPKLALASTSFAAEQQAVDVLLPHCTSDLSTSAPSWSVRYKDFRTDFSSATIVSRQRSGRSRRRRSSPVQHCSRRRCWQSGPLPAADSLLQRINNKHNLQYTIASYHYAHHHRRR
jgi:hypothetical protein